MSKWIDLIVDEKIIGELKISNDIHIWTLLWFMCTFIGALIPILYFSNYKFYITNKRAILQKGLFFIDEEEIRFEKIEWVIIKNSFGSKILTLQGTGGTMMEVKYVANANELKNSIYEIIESKSKV